MLHLLLVLPAIVVDVLGLLADLIMIPIPELGFALYGV
jgi:hypothetical protein